MKRMTLEPDGWECSLEECPPGPFLFKKEHLGFKSEYRVPETGGLEVFNEAGEYYCGEGLVQPLKVVWEDYDE